MKISIACLGHDAQRAVEIAAVAAAEVRGNGHAKICDRAATGSMRGRMSKMQMRGIVLNTEGELDGCDHSSMLTMDERIGIGWLPEFAEQDFVEVDVAADSLEGTELCASNAPNAICTLALSERGGILRAPENYMFKVAVGPASRGKIDPEAPIEDILRQIAGADNRDVNELNIMVLKRPRHTRLIARIRAQGAEVTEIAHGDLTGSLLCAMSGTGVHGAIGIGGGPEAFLGAAANHILGGETYARFVTREELEDPDDRSVIRNDMADRLREAGFNDPGTFMTASQMVPGKDIVFAFASVTNSELLRGVRKFKHGGRRVNSCLMIKQGNERIVRWCDVTETTNHGHVFSRDRD